MYNTTNSNINLSGYRVSDDSISLNNWIFPSVTISPHGYLLVFASGKNRKDTNELHTNFKINSSGEAIFLYDNFGLISDQSSAVNSTGETSYCRVPDGSSNWMVSHTPSPNASNNSSNQLKFSSLEGFYNSSFFLKINSIILDTIFYTLNGDIPNQGSFIYHDSLLIDNRSNDPNFFSEIPTTPKQSLLSYKAWEPPAELLEKGTILRCASFRNGKRTSAIYTKTFFVDSAINEKYSLPVISLITDKQSLFSADSGIFVPGVNFVNSNPEWTGNYLNSGAEWERDVHIEYFEKDGNLGFSQNAGIRIHGGKTRQAAQKSLRLYARKEYGEKYFNYNLLPQKQVNEYKRFLLRTTMGGWNGQTIITDALAQNIARGLNVDSQDSQPVVVFLNGEYWGIHTIRDRIDERYIDYTHGIDSDSIEFNENGNVNYHNLLEFLAENNLGDNLNYEYVKSRIDISNYMDYTITELFLKNNDWPANNMKMWRQIPNGKWRWVLYDVDAGFFEEDFDMLSYVTNSDSTTELPNPPSSTLLFRSLLSNEEFSSQFISRYADILNNEFRSEEMINKLDALSGAYGPEISSHIDRWNYPASVSSWEDDLEENLRLFLEKRPCFVRNSIMTFFSLDTFDFTCEFKEGDPMLVVAPNPTSGMFFIGNSNLEIKNASISITSMNGQLVYLESNVNLAKNERKYFELSHLSNTTYILYLKSNEYVIRKKNILMN